MSGEMSGNFFKTLIVRPNILNFHRFQPIRNATSGQTPVIYTDHWSGKAGKSKGFFWVREAGHPAFKMLKVFVG